MNDIHTLNGIKYVSRLITKEENALINKLRNDELGCTRCELSRTVGSQDYGVTITNDVMKTVIDGKHLSVQVSFCPFCGVAL